jgi:hypothetical protein
MGLPSVTAGRILKGQLKGNNGEEEETFLESLDHTALSKVLFFITILLVKKIILTKKN